MLWTEHPHGYATESRTFEDAKQAINIHVICQIRDIEVTYPTHKKFQKSNNYSSRYDQLKEERSHRSQQNPNNEDIEYQWFETPNQSRNWHIIYQIKYF